MTASGFRQKEARTVGVIFRSVSNRPFLTIRFPSNSPSVMLVLPTSSPSSIKLLQRRRQLFDRRRRLHQLGPLVGRKVELDDLLEAARAQLARHADEHAVDAVLALEVGRRRHDLLL